LIAWDLRQIVQHERQISTVVDRPVDSQTLFATSARVCKVAAVPGQSAQAIEHGGGANVIPDAPIGGRAILEDHFGWSDRALAPAAGSLPATSLRRLGNALTLVFGAEALIITRGVARLDPSQATEVMRWAAATLIRGALASEAEVETVSSRARPGGLSSQV
jgi:hypothetical protein